jgi:hypothetical protein
MRPNAALAALAWALAAACGRLHFDTDADTDGGGGGGGGALGSGRDAPAGSADAGTDCWAAWRAGTVQFGSAAPVSELNTAQTETDPSLADGGLTLYFDRGSADDRDLYMAQRPARGAAFGTPVLLSTISDPTEDDTRLTVTTDGLTGVFTSITSHVNYRLYQTQRASEADAFGAPTDTPFSLIDADTAHDQVDPELTADGLHLYFAPTTTGTQRIALATRATIADAFGSAAAIGGLAVGVSTQDPTISPDELVIAFSSSDASGHLTMSYATRTDPAAPFTQVFTMPGFAGVTTDGDPELAADGCEMFFDSEKATNSDLFVVDVVP